MASYEPIPEADPEDDFDVPINEDDDDNANANETGVFGPLSSTPYQTEQKEKSGLHEPPVFLEDLSELPGLSTTTFTAENEIFKEFPNADKTGENGESGKYQINPRLPKEVSRALGEGPRQTIRQEIERLSEGINENKTFAEDTTKDQTERNKARERAQMQISSRIDLQRQLDQLKTGEYTRDGGGQSISLEAFQKTMKKGKKEKNKSGKKKKNEKKS